MSAPIVSQERAVGFHGRISNADPHDLPAGGNQIQNNIQCLVPGSLRVRKGIQLDSNFTPSSPASTNLIGLYAYTRPEGDYVIGYDSAGAIKWRRAASDTTIASGKHTFYPPSFEKERRNNLIITNGLERGSYWNGLSAAVVKLGITAPASAPTAAPPTGGAATAGDYTLVYRYVTDDVPVARYSSMSAAVTVTAVANDEFTWSDIVTTTETDRVKKVQLWRSAAGASNKLYFIVEYGHNGTITSSANNGSGKCRFTVPAGHNLVDGATIDVVDGTHNGEHEVTAVTSTTIDTNTSFISDGGTGTWTIEGMVDDVASDATLIANAVADTTLQILVVLPDGRPSARRFVPPPKFKCCVKSFQDRFWYSGDVKYNDGTVSTTSGSATVAGSGTAWTTDMADRYIYVNGLAAPLKISSVASSTSLTASTDADASTSGVTYGIMSGPDERNKLYYSEADEPESVPTTNTITIQENTDDDDEIVGTMPFGSIMYILKERHIYSLDFARQPSIDANARLLVHRGAFNHNCYDFHEGIAYLMDAAGIYSMTTAGQQSPIGGPLQDMFRDATIDLANSKWFHVKVDPVFELVYFFVGLTADSSTRPKAAIVYSIRNGSWWTESYLDEIGASARLVLSGKARVLLGGEDDVVFKLNEGETDVVTSQTRGTATSVTSTTLTDTGASFGASVVGAPVAILSGKGKGQLRKITARTSTQLTVAAWTTTPDTTSVYLVGAVSWSFKTGIIELTPSKEHNRRAFQVAFNPTSGAATLDMRRYFNHESSPENNVMPQGIDTYGVVTRTASDPDDVVNLKLARLTTGNSAGWGESTFSGHRSDMTEGKRWVTAELRGFKGDDSIELYGLDIAGVDG